MCDRCAELEERIAYLESELGIARDSDRLQAIKTALRCRWGEAALLQALYRANGRTLTRWQAMHAIPSKGRGGQEDERDPKVVDVYVSRLRNSLGDRSMIVNVWGTGYQLTAPGIEHVRAILDPAPSRAAA